MVCVIFRWLKEVVECQQFVIWGLCLSLQVQSVDHEGCLCVFVPGSADALVGSGPEERL